MKRCSKCSIEKDVSEFRTYSCSRRNKIVTYPWCKSCTTIQNRKSRDIHRIKNRPKNLKYEITSREQKRAYVHSHYRIKCEKCDERRKYLLDFHHIDSSNKKFNPLNSYQISLKRIIQEIEKCITLCANCHREFHYLERHTNITIKQYLDEKQYIRAIQSLSI